MSFAIDAFNSTKKASVANVNNVHCTQCKMCTLQKATAKDNGINLKDSSVTLRMDLRVCTNPNKEKFHLKENENLCCANGDKNAKEIATCGRCIHAVEVQLETESDNPKMKTFRMGITCNKRKNAHIYYSPWMGRECKSFEAKPLDDTNTGNMQYNSKVKADIYNSDHFRSLQYKKSSLLESYVESQKDRNE